MSNLTNWPQLHGNFFEGKRALVTGGAGFIGSHLVDALLQLGAQITVIDDLSGGDEKNLESLHEIEFVRESILDADLLARLSGEKDYIFHLAALGSVPRSVRMPRLYQEVNSNGTFNVLEAARAAGVTRVIFSASSSAYGNTHELPKRESMPTRPLSPYAATKVAGESMMRAFSCSYGLDTVSLRYFNIFGPRQNANSAYAAAIAAFALATLNRQSPTIFGDGEQSRDFTFVDNAVHANLLAARSAAPLSGDIFNIACGKRTTINQLARSIAKLLRYDEFLPVYQAERSGDVKHSLAELARAEAALGYRPIVDFETGLRLTIAWYAEQSTPTADLGI